MSDARDEPASGARFLAFAGWESGGTTFEIVSRKRLDTRQVVPYFECGGETWAGVLVRRRASRALRGAPELGLEPIGIDFAHVDETGDILEYGKAIFAAHSGVTIDETALKIPLPSVARSIGYLTELALPLLVGISPPPADDLAVSWDGEEHTVRFRPLRELLAELEHGSLPFSEDLALLLHALAPQPSRALASRDDHAARALLEQRRDRVWDLTTLAREVARPASSVDSRRVGALAPDELRFLRLHLVTRGATTWELVTPGSGTSLAVLPYVVSEGHAHFLLWTETRLSALERRENQPIYDSPISPRYLNATAGFLAPAVAAQLASSTEPRDLAHTAESVLAAALGTPVRSIAVTRLGRAAEPAPSVSSELRHRVAMEIDAAELPALPDDVCLVRDVDLAEAVARGLVRDPVIALGLSLLRLPSADPFAAARRGDVAARLSFLSAMTAGSSVQRRLRSYSSIEREQLGAPTYARLMTLLQHEYGVRVAYPRTEADRSFFKAAFRVFMASDRAENRALQGLHWSHDAFHFALGNFTLPAMDGFDAWYESDAKAPELPDQGPLFDGYVRALKAAEDEATFFSFFTLFAEQPSLTVHVGKLTYWEATRRLGITSPAAARALFDDLTTRALLPPEIAASPVYQSDADLQSLLTYMLGFREYHLGDIRAAWKFASREPYRGFFLRYGIYESDVDAYVTSVRSFTRKLADLTPGLNPLLAATADVRVSLSLRVWDVVKSMRLARAAKKQRGARERAERYFVQLDRLAAELSAVRAEIENAEIVPRNEAIFARVSALAAALETLRTELWDEMGSTGGLAADVVAAERARELPR